MNGKGFFLLSQVIVLEIQSVPCERLPMPQVPWCLIILPLNFQDLMKLSIQRRPLVDLLVADCSAALPHSYTHNGEYFVIVTCEWCRWYCVFEGYLGIFRKLEWGNGDLDATLRLLRPEYIPSDVLLKNHYKVPLSLLACWNLGVELLRFPECEPKGLCRSSRIIRVTSLWLNPAVNKLFI